MSTEPTPPTVGTAFEDPGTRAAWEDARRRSARRLWLWSVLFALAVVAGFVLTGVFSDAGRPASQAGPALVGVGLLWYVCVLVACRGSLARLRQARSVLEAYPWQRVTAARKVVGTREPTGVPVQFVLADGNFEQHSGGQGGPEDDQAWSPTLSARDPRRWYRWDPALEKGAWFAGDIRLGGVLALPGGRGLMTVQRRNNVLHMERATAKSDHEGLLAAAAVRRG